MESQASNSPDKFSTYLKFDVNPFYFPFFHLKRQSLCANIKWIYISLFLHLPNYWKGLQILWILFYKNSYLSKMILNFCFGVVWGLFFSMNDPSRPCSKNLKFHTKNLVSQFNSSIHVIFAKCPHICSLKVHINCLEQQKKSRRRKERGFSWHET